ncbi:outer-membrane lipoprotein carrier protein LolA [Sandarakinorhabdus rubra]|uniref:outer-membrane lipoprotein carrier protein LolA n=1 Tax=Sandarakinorhabdus rubra TaxID=2672568 RepID=UPI0013DB3377|nr:outer-membrane lipoprotein carrier protein LolA [Sandarakinorhabdus rubra]
MRTLFPLLLIGPMLFAAPAAAATLADVSAALKGTTSLAADFSQAGADGRVLTGKLWLARPGRVRFQYDKAPMLLVGDGRTLSFVDYEVKQVSQWPVRRTPLQILLANDPDLAPVARIVGDDAGGITVEARDPKRPEFGTLTIRFVRNAAAPAGLALAGWTARDAQGGISAVTLSNQRYNASLKGVSFAFVDPRREGPR